MDDKCLAIFDIESNSIIDYISFKELGIIYLLRKDNKFIEKYVFRDKQSESIK